MNYFSLAYNSYILIFFIFAAMLNYVNYANL